MKINPLVVFTGLTFATFAALVYVERNTGADGAMTPGANVNSVADPKLPKAAEGEAAPATETAKVEVPAEAGEPKPADATTSADGAPVENAKIIPTFDTVRVEPSGDAVIAGRAEPGSEVVVKFNGLTVGTAVANAEGAFVVTPDKPLPSGPGALSIESKSNEMVVASADSVAVDVKAGAVETPLVAVLKPDEPTKLIQAPAKPVLPPTTTVNLDTVDYDQSGNIVFGGRGPAGSKVQIYVDNEPYGLAEIKENGTWILADLPPLAVGPHSLRADEIGTDGGVKSRIEMPFYREEPAKVASAAPAPEQTVAVADPAPAKVAKTPELVAKPEAPAVAAAQVPAPSEPAAVELAAVEPAAAEPDSTQLAPAAPAQIIIQPGNNLWKLSRKIYGKGMMYTVIYEANKGQIRKPDLIYPGQVFMTPDPHAESAGQ